MSDALASICILRLSAIGDVCHAATLVERIQRHWPETKITWVIGKIEYQLVGDMAGIEFIVFDKKLGLGAYKKLRQDIGTRPFDALLLMQVAFRANLAAACINAKQKIGFDWARSKELHWLFTNSRIAPRSQAHVLDGFMDFADALGVPPVAKPAWHIPIPSEAELWAKQQAEALSDFVVISPAASKAERNWTAAGYAWIADYLSSKGKQVVLCGGPGSLDREMGNAITALTSNVRTNFIGKTNLKQLLALLKQAQLVIAPDTGPAHMATTVGTDVIGLYAHSNPRRTGPYNGLDRVVSVYDQAIAQQQTKNWQQLPWGIRAKGNELMELISQDDVKAALDNWLG